MPWGAQKCLRLQPDQWQFPLGPPRSSLGARETSRQSHIPRFDVVWGRGRANKAHQSPSLYQKVCDTQLFEVEHFARRIHVRSSDWIRGGGKGKTGVPWGAPSSSLRALEHTEEPSKCPRLNPELFPKEMNESLLYACLGPPYFAQ